MLVRLDEAIELDAIDVQPVDVVFVLLLPAAAAGEQLTALASVAWKLRDAGSSSTRPQIAVSSTTS
jgi:nitrogen PTS system EIIA component